MRDDFAVFIITHKHPDNQITYNTLRSCGYTGKIYLIIDNTDETIQQYIDNYGIDSVIIFNKNYYINSDRFDNGTNEGIFACAIYARRAVEDIARNLGYKYFAMADDDITKLVIRFPHNDKLRRVDITNMDKVFDAHIQLLSLKNIACIGFGGVQNYFSGAEVFSDSNLSKRIIPYQLFLRDASTDVLWSCWYGEDDVEAFNSNITGRLWFASLYVMLETMPNGTGSMQSTYKTKNSYIMAMSEFRYFPGMLKIYIRPKSKTTLFGVTRKNANWAPKVINEKYKIKE